MTDPNMFQSKRLQKVPRAVGFCAPDINNGSQWRLSTASPTSQQEMKFSPGELRLHNRNVQNFGTKEYSGMHKDLPNVRSQIVGRCLSNVLRKREKNANVETTSTFSSCNRTDGIETACSSSTDILVRAGQPTA
jgi:hypothetical protein